MAKVVAGVASKMAADGLRALLPISAIALTAAVTTGIINAVLSALVK